MSGIESNPGPAVVKLNLGLINARSIVNKAALIHDLISDFKIDILAVTETWVYENSPNVHKQEAAPEGFSIVHAHRAPRIGTATAHGGGVALIHRDTIQVKVIPTTTVVTTSFELLLVKITNCIKSFSIAIIYRPPTSSLTVFTTELSDLIYSGLLGPRYIICGDLNCPGASGTRGLVGEDLLDLIDSHSLIQHVQGATSHSGNILDHILTPIEESMVYNVDISDVGISDHSLITCVLHERLHTAVVTSATFRNWKRLDLAIFRDKLTKSSACLRPALTAERFATQLEQDVVIILDELVPFCKSTKRQGKANNSWLTPEATAAKQKRRRLERRWKSTNQEVDRVNYRVACRAANRLIKEARREHLTRSVVESSRDPRSLWRTVKGLLHPCKASKFQSGLCHSFSSFFRDKVARVRSSVDAMKSQQGIGLSQDITPGDRNSLFCSLEPVTLKEVSNLLLRLPNKSSPLDYVHTSVLKSCSDVFAPLIAHLANLSFAEGCFPAQFKLAQVTPLLKKPGLDASDPANYRPISNLNTIGKIIERLFLARLMPHIGASKYFSPMQSAYRKLHSTETALLKIMDDLYRIVDHKKSAVLISLDLSAAFDTIDHAILTQRLKQRFGVTGVVLNWIVTYLQERSQYVKVGEEKSAVTCCEVGVPQGSVLGPILFSAYVSPISDVISSFGVQFHQYADDTQLYTAVTADDDESCIRNLEQCTKAVRDWFLQNGMLLNPDKSEVMLVASRAQALKFAGGAGVSVAGSDIAFAVQLKSLGVVIDRYLSFDQHVKDVVKSSNFHIRGLRHIRPFLDQKTANTVACSIVSSRLDYCNSLLSGISAKNVRKLQTVQNSLARVVSGTKRRDHIKPVLKTLHWLPITKRIEFKVALITHKVISTQEPKYLSDIVSIYRPTRELRSSSQQRLSGHTTRTKTGERSFSSTSSRVWNGLPADLRAETCIHTFKSKLKTHLFKSAYCM
jgi:hypothetical protein